MTQQFALWINLIQQRPVPLSFVWRNEYKKKHLTATVRNGRGSVMLRDHSSSRGSESLVQIHGITNSLKYPDILNQNLMEVVRKLTMDPHSFSEQNNGPKHQNRNGSWDKDPTWIHDNLPPTSTFKRFWVFLFFKKKKNVHNDNRYSDQCFVN